jgi:hypothetical protein
VTAAHVEKPAAHAIEPEPEPTLPPRNAERTIGLVRPKLRACYERGLAIDPRMPGGAILVHARVGADGSVRTAAITKRSGLSPVVATCVADQLQATHFEPSGGPTVLDVPVHFVRR